MSDTTRYELDNRDSTDILDILSVGDTASIHAGGSWIGELTVTDRKNHITLEHTGNGSRYRISQHENSSPSIYEWAVGHEEDFADWRFPKTVERMDIEHTIPIATTEYEEVPIHAIDTITIVNDTGSELHYYPNAKGAWTDHTGKEFTSVVVDSTGEERKTYCGNIVYSGSPTTDDIPTPTALIEHHDPAYSDSDGEQEWGYIL